LRPIDRLSLPKISNLSPRRRNARKSPENSLKSKAIHIYGILQYSTACGIPYNAHEYTHRNNPPYRNQRKPAIRTMGGYDKEKGKAGKEKNKKNKNKKIER
jgi:hypothetical protein